jgi:hypothetical protein
VILAALVGLFSTSRANSILLSDDFSGPSLDTTKWETILPYGGSSIVQAGGELTTTGRGILATVDGFTDSHIINGAFTMNDGLEHFDIALRTNLSVFGSYNEMAGVIVTFVNDGKGVAIQEYPTGPDSGSSVVGLATTGEGGYNFVTGQTYFFSIADDGTNISVNINGLNVLSAASTFATGDKIALYSREFGSTSTSIDAINIVGVPDLGNSAELLIIGLFGLALLEQRKNGGFKVS